MARRSNLPNLIYDAFNNPGEGGATASNRNWIATRMGNYVGVEHHGTHMFNVSRAGIVEPVDRGHGSMTDRCGVRRITAGFGCGGPEGIGYRELYDDEPMNRLGSDQWRHAIDRSSWATSGISEPRSSRGGWEHMPDATAITHSGSLDRSCEGGSEHTLERRIERAAS